MSHFEFKPFYHRNLPHIQPPGATFFVTFNLSGSIPRRVLQEWRSETIQHEKEKLDILKLEKYDCLTSIERKLSIKKHGWFEKIEGTLDNADIGPVWLKDHRIAKEVSDSLHYRDGKVYSLDAYCIMANHVHVVFTPLVLPTSDSDIETPCPQDEMEQTDCSCYISLSSIMHSLKGYTARKANQILGRSGPFWHHESYDHIVRNRSELHHIIMYVLNNPVKVGLVADWRNWQWSYCRTKVDGIL